MACLFLPYILFYIPETRLSYASSELAQAVANHKSDDPLRRAAEFMLSDAELAQYVSLKLFRVVILFDILVLSLFVMNLLPIRRLRKEHA
jgi:hypothetical protein